MTSEIKYSFVYYFCLLFSGHAWCGKLYNMDISKQSFSDKYDKLTIEDVAQLGGDQVILVSLSVTPN